MRDFLLLNGARLVWGISALHLLFLLLAFVRFKQTKEPLYLLTGLVACGLFYDALVQALGTLLVEGGALLFLSRFRFVFHGALIPLLFPICAYGLRLPRAWKTAVWIATGVVIALGIAEGFATALEPARVAGVLRFTSGEATPVWAESISMLLAFGTILPVIAAGIAVWIRQKTPLLLCAGLFMFAFAALGPATGNLDLNFLITMFGEVFLALFFLLFAHKEAKKET